MKIVLLLPFLQLWPVKTLQNVCPHLIASHCPPIAYLSIPSLAFLVALGVILLGFSIVMYPCLLSDATMPPSSKHS